MALTFNGLNYISKATALIAAAPMTFTCFFKPTTQLADAYLMGVTSATSTHSSIFAMKMLTASGKICCYIGNDAASTTDATALATTVLSNGTWYHLACVFTSTTSRTAYVNGAGATTSVVSVTPGTCDSSYIGDVKFNALVKTGAIGSIAYPAFWNTALAAKDVLSLANAIAPWRYKALGLVGYPRLTGGSSPEPDLISGSWTLVAG